MNPVLGTMTLGSKILFNAQLEFNIAKFGHAESTLLIYYAREWNVTQIDRFAFPDQEHDGVEAFDS